MIQDTVTFSKNTVNIFFHILTKCNLNCCHCYINPEEHGHQTLSLDTIKSWLRIFSDRHPHPNIIFLGGEPTLHPDLAEAVKYSKKIKYQSVTIDTNGFLFHDISQKVTPQEVDYFSFSLDGASVQKNDRIRGKGSFDACISGIKKVKSLGFKTSMIFTVSRANIDELVKMPEMIAQLDIDRFFIQVIGLRGKMRSTGQTTPQITREEWLTIIPKVAKLVADRGVTVTYPKVYLESNEEFACAGIEADNYFIFPNGRVYKCPVCEDYPLHSYEIIENQLIQRPKLTESDLFGLNIPEGCIMNKLFQPSNIEYDDRGHPLFKIACCMLKNEIH